MVVLAAALAALPLVRPVPAQKFQPKTIQFKGDPEYTDQDLMDAAGIKKGEMLTTDEMNAAAKRLMGSGVFDQLAYKFDGQDLVFNMTPATELYLVRLDNLPLQPGDQLDAELHNHLPLYHGKVPSEGTLLDDVRAALEQMLAAEGVHASVVALPYGEVRQSHKVTAMSFSIQSPPVRIGTVAVNGASGDMLPALQSVISGVKHDAFDSGQSASVLRDRMVQFYRDRGYAAVKINVVQAGGPQEKADAIEVPFSATVQEGKVYKTGWIHLPAGTLVTQDEADKIVAAHQSEASGEALRTLLSLIGQRYGAKGYLDFVATSQPEFNDASSTVNYTIDISTGSPYHLGFVKFDNVSDDVRSHLMRAWQLMPGDAFDESYPETFLVKAQRDDPALRPLLKMAMRAETSADPETHQVDVVIRLEK